MMNGAVAGGIVSGENYTASGRKGETDEPMSGDLQIHFTRRRYPDDSAPAGE